MLDELAKPKPRLEGNVWLYGRKKSKYQWAEHMIGESKKTSKFS